MISSTEVKIKITDNLTSDYIESELKNMGYDVLRWAITHIDNDCYTLDVSYVVK